MALTLMALTLLGGLCHLEQVPHSGRWHFAFVSKQRELLLGEQGQRQVLEHERATVLPPGHTVAAAVTQVP